MKRIFALGLLPILTFMASAAPVGSVAAQTANSQPSATLLVEDFTYAAGSALTANGWNAHSGAGTNPIVTSAPGLTFSGYPSSGIGNAVALTTSGEDDNKSFAAQTTGSVYAAFLVNVSEASADPNGGYFFHLGPDPVGTTFRGRVFVKKDASNNVAFGISKGATTAPDVVFTPFSYALNTTYLVVVKYTIVDGATNDTVSLFVRTDVPAAEPAATLSATDVATQSDVSPGTVSLRQGAAATSPTARVDGIRVGTDWASVTQAVAVQVQHVVDYNGDGRTDFSVVRNQGGGANGQAIWYNLINGTGTSGAVAWGLASDFYVPADYDGDGKTDISIWRPGPSTVASWYTLLSSTNTVRFETFGQTGDDPTVVGDYDGDGKDDIAVYRDGVAGAPQSTFYYRTSQNGPVIFAPWGQMGDYPAPGDYDGDGKNDLSVQRDPGNGQAVFITKLSTGPTTFTPFGTPGDGIAPGDYDGDGKTDFAVFRDQGGVIFWYYLPSGGGSYATVVFGSTATDLAVPGDYDGDGKTDVAIWRRTTGQFWISNSGGSGVAVANWGSSGDYPVANFNTH